MAAKYPNFHRQKFLLMFLKLAGGVLSKIDFQKLVFLFQQKYKVTFYEFIPYHYGCYSLQANEDMDILQKQGWLAIKDKQIELIDKHPKSIDCYADVKRFLSTCDDLRGDELIRRVYLAHPYYAINSRIAHNLLTEEELAKIKNEKQKFRFTTTTLFTIGYEGTTIEAYINKLIQNDIRLLCDVRNNPLSRKYGFSKTMLAKVLQELNIAYVHIPALGIVSEKRKNLKEQTDYKALFDEYNKALPKKKVYIDKVFALLRDQKRIALTCFEKDPDFCHRHVLSQFMKDNYSVKVVDL
ncbi:MAG: hypothetical protein CVU54_10590 [Deltaproteobacteria bacterium HGW-Deltaproteobacteria-12]|jgi:uncharacterized protein (DUF488 family)|nr:MAG: hypothetical protein CVU54_10590 [Deltaproteobacteria bacterium HGW-Deltaproteobacteria-12]